MSKPCSGEAGTTDILPVPWKENPRPHPQRGPAWGLRPPPARDEHPARKGEGWRGLRLSRNQVSPQPRTPPPPSDGRVPLDGSVQTRRHQRLPLSVPGAYGAGPSDGSLCPVPHFLRPPQAQDAGAQVPTAWTSPWGGVSPASACDTHGPTEP